MRGELEGPGETGHSEDGCTPRWGPSHIPRNTHTHARLAHKYPKVKRLPEEAKLGCGPQAGPHLFLEALVPLLGLPPIPTVATFSNPKSEEVSQEDSLLYLLALWL